MDRPKAGMRLRLCLAASGGGHLRQLLDLEPAWGCHDAFFISEPTALARSVAAKHPTYFVDHLALGQARLGAPMRMAWAAVRNFTQSARIILRKRPQIVISTGAGAVFFSVLLARLLGAKVLVVESFARFDRPSLFGRMIAPFAHRKVIQSAALANVWPDAAVFDPLRILDGPRPAKKPLLFATVGAILPFDRLVRMVAEAKKAGIIREDVLVQTGEGGLAPDGINTVETLDFDRIQAVLGDAELVVCHGGTGSVITALRQGCRVVAVPRLFSKGEVYDDHQEQITRAFAARGLISVANTSEELQTALDEARARPPVMATTDPVGLIEHIRALLARWAGEGGASATSTAKA